MNDPVVTSAAATGWQCPVHHTDLTYAGSDPWQEHWRCPVDGCGYGTWLS